MPVRLTRLILIAVSSFGLILARPEPAAACIWNVLHYFNPWPPCEIKDEPLLHRVKQANVRLAAVLYETATKITMVKREIYQWQRAYETATNYENVLRSVYGDLTANPLPSLIYSWNRSNIGAYVRLTPTGRFGVSADIVDLRHVADSIAGAFLHDVDVRRIYAEFWEPEVQRLERVVEYTGRQLEHELANLGDYRRHTEAFRDSLRLLGNRVADRYTGVADAAGDAEAHISYLSIQLSKLRGTALHAQSRAITSRLRALEHAAEAEALIHKNDGRRASMFAW